MTSTARKIILAFLAMVIIVVLIILGVRVSSLSGALTDYDRALNEQS